VTVLDLDLLSTPFSRRGSYLAVSQLVGPAATGIFLRSVHGDVRRRELARLLLDGDEAPAVTATPGRLSLRSGTAAAELSLDGAGTAVLRARQGTLTLEMQVSSQYDVVLEEQRDVWRFIASGANRNYRIAVRGGAAHLETGWDGVKDTTARLSVSAGATVQIDEFATTPPVARALDLDAAATAAEEEFAAWFARHGRSDEDAATTSAARLAAYVLWAALVPAGGALRRESMLMSKNWMTNVWAWDHCFNAMALWRDPGAAADQLLTLFDHQDEHGAIPDYINDAGVEPNFVKPPIHGWAVSWLLARDGLDRATVAALYEPLARWTDWWFAHRVYGDDDVPSYNHGNDSGWDNSTVFGWGVPVQSPDLLAFLALQMTALAELASRLDRPDAARRWAERSRRTVDRMLERFWVGGRFVARRTVSGEPVVSDSLLTLMPLALGDALPPEVFAATTRRLVEGGYLTPHGAATEPVESPHYVSDGYWRGPIWAPSTMLLVDGLRRGGRQDLGDDLARRFIRTCTRGGMAENFDALSGDGLRDLSMTWTASVFLTLLETTPSDAAAAREGSPEAAAA
jgi:putative isomerase